MFLTKETFVTRTYDAELFTERKRVVVKDRIFGFLYRVKIFVIEFQYCYYGESKVVLKKVISSTVSQFPGIKKRSKTQISNILPEVVVCDESDQKDEEPKYPPVVQVTGFQQKKKRGRKPKNKSNE